MKCFLEFLKKREKRLCKLVKIMKIRKIKFKPIIFSIPLNLRDTVFAGQLAWHFYTSDNVTKTQF